MVAGSEDGTSRGPVPPPVSSFGFDRRYRNKLSGSYLIMPPPTRNCGALSGGLTEREVSTWREPGGKMNDGSTRAGVRLPSAALRAIAAQREARPDRPRTDSIAHRAAPAARTNRCAAS